MKNFKYIIGAVLGIAISVPFFAMAASAVPWSIQGLTDTFISPNLVNGVAKGVIISASSTVNSTLSVSSLTSGNCVQASTGGLLVSAAGACGSGSGVGNWFTPQAGYNSTSTVIGFLQGLFSTASSTFSGPFRLTALSNGQLNVNGGLVYSGATTTFSGGLTYLNGNVTNSGVTSIVAGNGISISGATGAVTVTNSIGYPFPSNATGTTLTLNGGLVSVGSTTISSLGSGVVSANNGLLYSGATTTATCAGTVSCSTFTVLGSAPITLTGTGSTGGSFPFSVDSNFGTVVYSTSTPTLWFKNTGNSLFASGTIQAVFASTTAVSALNGLYINNWALATSTTVCKTGTACQFSTITAAIASGARDIYVKDGTYAEQLTLTNTKTYLHAQSLNTIIQCNGSTQSPCLTSSDESVVQGFTFNEANAALVGVAYDASEHALTKFLYNRVNNFATSTKFTDTTNNTFYNTVQGNTFFNTKVCYQFDGTQANANWVIGNRCRPMAVDGAFGAYNVDARGINYTDSDVEGTTTTKASVGYYFDATSRDDSVSGGWDEAFGTGVVIASGANNISFDHTTITSHGTDIIDSGTNSSFLSVNRTGTKLFILPQLVSNGSTTVSSVGSGVVAANNGLLYGTATSTLNSGTGISISGTGALFANSGVTINNTGVTLVTAAFPLQVIGSGSISLAFNGLSTSTDAVLGNLPYFSGPNTFANVATTTLVAGTNISFSGGTPVVIGSSPITINSTGSGSFPFTPTNNYAVNTSATSTPIWARLGLFASSTSNFDQINVGSTTSGTMSTSTIFGNLTVSGNASSTFLTVSNLGGSGNGFPVVNAAGTFASRVQLPLSYANGGTGSTTGVQGQVPYYGSSAMQSQATGTITCTGTASCGAGSYVLGANLTITGSGSGSFPFTPLTNFAVNTSATTTPIWAQAGIFASSTSRIASTTFGINGNVMIGTSTDTSFSGNPAKLTVNMGVGNTSEEAVDVIGNTNDFIEYNCKNLSTGTSAQCGYTATADNGTATTGFMFMGKNNSAFWNPQTYNVGGSGDSNILSLGGDLFIAQGTASQKTHFLNGGTSTSTNEVMTFNGTNVGIGTTTPAEKEHINCSTGYCTLRVQSNTTYGGIFALDTDNSFNVGALSSGAQLNLLNNNAVGASLYNPTSAGTILQVNGPSGNPQESTFTTKRDFGSGNFQGTDWTNEDFGVDAFTSINSYASGTKSVLPIMLRGWVQSCGAIHLCGTPVAFFDPARGVNAIGNFASSTGVAANKYPTNTVLSVGASSTALREFTVYKSSTVSDANSAFTVLQTGNVGIGTTTPPDLLDVVGSFPNFKVVNTATSQFAGAGFDLVNQTASLGNQAGTAFYSGINDGSATQGYFAIDQTNTTGGGAGHWLLFDYNAQSSSFYSNNAVRMTINSSGNIGVATTTPQWPLTSYAASTAGKQFALSAGAATPQWTFSNESGNLYVGTTTLAGTATSTQLAALELRNGGQLYAPFTTVQSGAATDYWCYDANGQFIRVSNTCTVSAAKFKKDITPLSADQGLAAVLAMQPVNYSLNDLGLVNKDNPDDTRRQIGFVADDAEKTVPLLVLHDQQGDVHGFNYEQYTANLTLAIQQLNAKIEGKVVQATRSAEENWQWAAIALLVLWNVYLTFKRRKL